MHDLLYAQIDADKFTGENVPRTPAFNEDDVSDKPKHIQKQPKLSNSDISELTRHTGTGYGR